LAIAADVRVANPGWGTAPELARIEALEVSVEKALGPEHPDLGMWLNNLASLCQDTGRYADLSSPDRQLATSLA
jgi:hypothetical protein